MAQNKIYKFRDIVEATFFLNGGIKGSQSLRQASTNTRTNLIPAIFGLVGKQLVFTSPSSTTVTFTTGTAVDDPQSLTFQDIKSQIEAALSSAVLVNSIDAFISIIEVAPTSGVALGAAGSPAADARPFLGFSLGDATTGKVYKPAAISATAPCWTWADTNNENMHVIYTWE